MKQAAAEILVRYVLPHALPWLSNLKRSFNDLEGLVLVCLKAVCRLVDGLFVWHLAKGRTTFYLTQRRKDAKESAKIICSADGL
jgi:hypothetical protein